VAGRIQAGDDSAIIVRWCGHNARVRVWSPCMARGFLRSQDTIGPGNSRRSPAQVRLPPRLKQPDPRAAVVGEAGEPRAARLTRLITEHLDFVWRLLRRLGLDRVQADDVSQEVFLVVVRRLDQIEPGRERAFLYGVALRAIANARRGLRRRREVPEDPAATATATGALPDEAASRERPQTRARSSSSTLRSTGTTGQGRNRSRTRWT